MICEFQIFKKSEKIEIIYMAQLMQSRLSIVDEEIVTQGDEANCMYIIFSGTVNVFLNRSHFNANQAKIAQVKNARKMF